MQTSKAQIEYKQASNVDNSPVKRVEKPSVPPQNTLLSLSHDASHMVTASKRKFYCLRVNIESRVYELAGWGSGCEDSKDAITAVLCLPVYIPSNGGS